MAALMPPDEDSWTFEDLCALPEPEDGTRYELIDGQLVVSPLTALPHLRVVTLLHELLNERVPKPFAITQMGGVLERRVKDSYLIPDIMIIPRSALDEAESSAFEPATAVLVVEVLSPSSRKRDHITKRRCYGRMGIPHYWIIDPKARELRVMELPAGATEYVDVTNVVAGEEWQTEKPFPFKVDPSEFC